MSRRAHVPGMSFSGIAGIALLLVATGGCASLADRIQNRTVLSPPYRASPGAAGFHRNAFVADLHADTLLWDRDLLATSSRGHVDLPRLRQGNVGLQVFFSATQSPLFLSLDDNIGSPDAIGLLAWLQDWPRDARATRTGRAMHMSLKLKDFVGRSGGALRLILDRNDLKEIETARNRGGEVIGVMLGIEGAQALDGDLGNVDRLFGAGYRIFGLSHFFDTEFAGSAHGREKGGLTPRGRELVGRILAAGMIIDLSHASPKTIEDTLSIGGVTAIASHGGVRGTCDTNRNLSDNEVRAIAATGGVVGIGYFRNAVCGGTIADIVRAMRHAAEIAGVDHVALGSDWDGEATVIDSAGIPLLTEALLESGFREEDVAAILGGNVLRIFRASLPPGP